MSAFIVQDGVINRIVNLLWADDLGGTKYISHAVRRLGYRPGIECKLLARHMHNLNRFAMWERYGIKCEYSFQYEFAWPGCKYQILKDLQCFLYQCSEGRADETRLFKALERAKEALMQDLISAYPEYKSALWDKE